MFQSFQSNKPNMDLFKKEATTAEILRMRHIRILRMFLYLMGAWPVEVLGETYPLVLRWYRKQLPLQTTLVAIGSLYYMYIHFGELSFFVLSDLFITMSLAVITIPKVTLVCLKKYRQMFKDFFEEYNLKHHIKNIDYNKHITGIVEKISYWFTIYEASGVLAAITFFNVAPITNSIKMGVFSHDKPDNFTASELEFSVHMAFPGLDCSNYFILTSFWNCLSTYNCGITVSIFDLLMLLMVFQIIGHLQILIHEVEDLCDDIVIDNLPFDQMKTKSTEMKMYTYEENKMFHNKLVDIINHHRLVVRFSDQVSNCFGIVIAANLSFHLINGCIVLIMIFSNDPNAVSRFLPLTVINFCELIQVCVIYEIVGLKSEKLVDAVYMAPWERADNANRRCLRYLLQRVQAPIQMSAAGVITIGVQTMVKILKTNISYFMFFQTLN